MRPDAVPRRRLEVRMRKFRGALLVAGPESSVELSDSAAFIFRNADGIRSVREIGVLLARQYDIPVEMAVEDTAELLDDLVDQHIMELTEQPRNG